MTEQTGSTGMKRCIHAVHAVLLINKSPQTSVSHLPSVTNTSTQSFGDQGAWEETQLKLQDGIYSQLVYHLQIESAGSTVNIIILAERHIIPV